MVNWQESDIQLSSGHVALYLVSICTGIYLWEFTLNLVFDWQYFCGKRPFRWTLIPYLVARYLCAATFILDIYGSNMFRNTKHCTIWAKLAYACAHLAIAAATILLVMRVIALAGRKLWITVCLIILWLAECGTLVHTFVVIEGVYVPQLFACAVTHTVRSRLNITFSFSVNFVCLALVLFFLVRSPGNGLWSLLLSQGVTYFAVVMVAYIPPVVLLILNLNDGLNLSLQSPALIALVICATRMHRALVTFNETGIDAFPRGSTWMNASGQPNPARPIAIRIDRIQTNAPPNNLGDEGTAKIDTHSERSAETV